VGSGWASTVHASCRQAVLSTGSSRETQNRVYAVLLAFRTSFSSVDGVVSSSWASDAVRTRNSLLAAE
jgi:hypothetical protein